MMDRDGIAALSNSQIGVQEAWVSLDRITVYLSSVSSRVAISCSRIPLVILDTVGRIYLSGLSYKGEHWR